MNFYKKVEQPQEDSPLMIAYRELDKARKSGDREEIIKAEDRILDLERQKFVSEMSYDELNYKLKKLQNSQRLEPSNEKLKQIVALKQKLDALELEELNK